MKPVDDIDRQLIALLQRDATQSYAALGKAVGLSAGAAHERVRKLREQGVIRATTIDVDPAALDREVLAFVLVDSTAWMGDRAEDFAAVPEIQEAHVIAGSAAVLVKVRTASTERLQDVLRRLYAIEGSAGRRQRWFWRPSSNGRWTPVSTAFLRCPGRSACTESPAASGRLRSLSPGLPLSGSAVPRPPRHPASAVPNAAPSVRSASPAKDSRAVARTRLPISGPDVPRSATAERRPPGAQQQLIGERQHGQQDDQSGQGRENDEFHPLSIQGQG